MKYLDCVFIPALMLVATFPSWSMYPDYQEIRFPSVYDIVVGLNHGKRIISVQNFIFTIESQNEASYHEVSSADITSMPTWNKPEKEPSFFSYPNLDNKIVSPKDPQYSLARFSIKVPVTIKFFNSSPAVDDILVIKLSLPSLEGYPSKPIIIGNGWNPASFAVVTPLRKSFYDDQQNHQTFLCPHIVSHIELLTQLHFFYPTDDSATIGFDFAGNSWFISDIVRTTLLDWSANYAFLAIYLIGNPEFVWVKDLVRARCHYRLFVLHENQAHPFDFSLSAFIHD